MSECPVVYGDPDITSAPRSGRMQPGITRWNHHDFSSIDCNGAGVTVNGVIAAIHADDDDGLLTLGTTVVDTDGLGWVQSFTVAADETQRAYQVEYSITTSDSQLLKRQEWVYVVPTMRPWAA